MMNNFFLKTIKNKLDFLHSFYRHHDTQHNDIQHNNTQHNNTQHNNTQHNDTQYIGRELLMLNVIYAFCHLYW